MVLLKVRDKSTEFDFDASIHEIKVICDEVFWMLNQKHSMKINVQHRDSQYTA